MKTILVTGATRGIGRAIAEKLLAEGHRVCAVYKESADLAEELVGTYGDRVLPFQVDLADSEQIKQFLIKLEDIELNGIVNNAGIVYLTKWDELDFAEWDKH